MAIVPDDAMDYAPSAAELAAITADLAALEADRIEEEKEDLDFDADQNLTPEERNRIIAEIQTRAFVGGISATSDASVGGSPSTSIVPIPTVSGNNSPTPQTPSISQTVMRFPFRDENPVMEERSRRRDLAKTCKNCSGPHDLRDCWIADNEGFQLGCPACNNLSHDIMDCRRGFKLQELWFLLVLNRHNKPPFRSPFAPWDLDPRRWNDLLTPDSNGQLSPVRPWTPAFALQQSIEAPFLRDTIWSFMDYRRRIGDSMIHPSDIGKSIRRVELPDGTSGPLPRVPGAVVLIDKSTSRYQRYSNKPARGVADTRGRSTGPSGSSNSESELGQRSRRPSIIGSSRSVSRGRQGSVGSNFDTETSERGRSRQQRGVSAAPNLLQDMLNQQREASTSRNAPQRPTTPGAIDLTRDFPGSVKAIDLTRGGISNQNLPYGELNSFGRLPIKAIDLTGRLVETIALPGYNVEAINLLGGDKTIDLTGRVPPNFNISSLPLQQKRSRDSSSDFSSEEAKRQRYSSYTPESSTPQFSSSYDQHDEDLELEIAQQMQRVNEEQGKLNAQLLESRKRARLSSRARSQTQARGSMPPPPPPVDFYSAPPLSRGDFSPTASDFRSGTPGFSPPQPSSPVVGFRTTTPVAAIDLRSGRPGSYLQEQPVAVAATDLLSGPPGLTLQQQAGNIAPINLLAGPPVSNLLPGAIDLLSGPRGLDIRSGPPPLDLSSGLMPPHHPPNSEGDTDMS